MSDVIRSGDGQVFRADGRAPIRIVSDGIRTRVLTALGEEIPHVTAVEFSAEHFDTTAIITVRASVDLTVYGHEFEKEEDDDADRL